MDDLTVRLHAAIDDRGNGRQAAAHRKIVDLHQPHDDHPMACSECGTPGEYSTYWPCPTLRLFAEAYEVEVADPKARCGVCGSESDPCAPPPGFTEVQVGTTSDGKPILRPVLNAPMRMDAKTGAVCWCPIGADPKGTR